jgi:hypothetical protein
MGRLLILLLQVKTRIGMGAQLFGVRSLHQLVFAGTMYSPTILWACRNQTIPTSPMLGSTTRTLLLRRPRANLTFLSEFLLFTNLSHIRWLVTGRVHRKWHMGLLPILPLQVKTRIGMGA